jgi:hypothetical protein
MDKALLDVHDELRRVLAGAEWTGDEGRRNLIDISVWVRDVDDRVEREARELVAGL